MLKLKLQYFGHLMRGADFLEKTQYQERLRAGGDEDDRGWDGWMGSPTQWTWIWVNSGSWWWTGRPRVLQSMGLRRVRHDWVTELKESCASTHWTNFFFFFFDWCLALWLSYAPNDTQQHRILVMEFERDWGANEWTFNRCEKSIFVVSLKVHWVPRKRWYRKKVHLKIYKSFSRTNSSNM